MVPLVESYMHEHPELRITLDLSDRLVDLLNEGVDCAVRIGEMLDSSLVSSKLGEMRRAVVASPAYIDRNGAPATPADLHLHNCLSLGQQRGWLLRDALDGEVVSIKVSGNFECNDGAVLHEWALAGKGLAWRSMWEVGTDLASGRLVSVLDEYTAPPMGIFAIFPQRKHLPLRVRLFVDHLKKAFGDSVCWSAA